jgi:rRNA maturation RNase YbeY
MILIKNTQKKVPVNVERLQKDAQRLLHFLGYADYDLGIWITTNQTIRKYNAAYRDKNKPTDILSFPFHTDLQAGDRINPESDDEKNLGDIIISAEYVNARLGEYGTMLNERMQVLLVHGVCHLLGYDHITEDDFIEMERMENLLLRQL